MSRVLGLGKVTREVFMRTVLPNIPVEKDIELDGATTALTENTVIAHSPSIGVPLEALGFFAFHYSASNVANKFGKPTHLISGIYLPLKTSEDDLETIVKTLGGEARKYGVTITAGQTATYYGIEIPLLTATCMGEALRSPSKPSTGDKVILVGEIGGEAVWLNNIAKGIEDNSWRRYTPLPSILTLQPVKAVKMMHDVSEGGITGSLLEISNSLGMGLNVDTDKIIYANGTDGLDGDLLRAPTYGALIVISDKDGVSDVLRRCSEKGIPCSVIGEVHGSGLTIDGEQVSEQKRVEMDEIYGSFTPPDPVLNELEDAVEALVKIEGFDDLVPQVGSNMVYAMANPVDSANVAGVEGRIIKGRESPMVCGDFAYDASAYMASVILESIRFDKRKLSAVNIRGGDDIPSLLDKAELTYFVLPTKLMDDGCPVRYHLEHSDELLDAYIHPGDFGIEPTTTIIAENPARLVEIISRMV